MRTQGKIILAVHRSIVLETDGGWVVNIGQADHPADAQTWAIAHNASNAIDALGFDGDKAIGGLAHFLAEIEQCRDDNGCLFEETVKDAVNAYFQSITEEKAHGV